MAVGYRSSSTSGTADSQVNPKTVPVPTGAAIGDIALLAIEQWSDTSTNPVVTWPSGFTEIVNVNFDADQGWVRLKSAWKRLTAADTGTYSMSWTGSQWNMAHCILVTGGLAAGDPIEATHTATTLTGTAVPATTVSPAAAGDMLVNFATNESSATQSTPPTGFTNVQNHVYLRTNYRISAASGSQSATGAVITTGGPQIAALIAIKPAAGGATDLVVNGAAQAHTADSPTLTQVHSLTVNGSAQAHTSDAAALTQVHVLSVNPATHGQAAESPTLSTAAVLAGLDATHAQAADSLTLTQVHNLVVGDAAQANAAGSPSLTQVHSLAVDGTLQAQAADSPTLTQTHVLTVAAAVQGHIADSPTLTFTTTDLTVGDAVQAHTSSTVTLTQAHSLAVNGAVHLQSTSTVTIVPVVPREDLTVTVGPTRVGSLAAGPTRQSLTASDTRDNAAGVAATRSSTSIGPTRRDRGV